MRAKRSNLVDPGRVEGPALNDIEGPAPSGVGVPALSQVEGPALSEVEGPDASGVEGSQHPPGGVEDGVDMHAAHAAVIERALAQHAGAAPHRMR